MTVIAIVYIIIGIYIILSIIVVIVYFWLKNKEAQLASYTDDEWNLEKNKPANRLARGLMESRFFNALIVESTYVMVGAALLLGFFLFLFALIAE